jgi:hypothetical protein
MMQTKAKEPGTTSACTHAHSIDQQQGLPACITIIFTVVKTPNVTDTALIWKAQ